MRILLAGLLATAIAAAQTWDARGTEKAREEYAFSIGVQAYIYCFSQVVMGLTRDQGLPPDQRNRLMHARALATHESKAVVAPNNDTLYSTAWLDLAKEPVTLHLPDMGERYFVFQFIDAYTNNFAYIGTRTTGQKGGDWVIAGPSWRGATPAGARRIDAPTNTVWIIGRVLVDGPEDAPNVFRLQDQMKLGSGQLAQRSRARPAVPQIDAMNVQEFFGAVARTWKTDPPPVRDEAVLAQFARIGLKPGSDFDSERLDPATRRGLARALETGRGVVNGMPGDGEVRNGWLFSTLTPYGTDYLRRTRVARGGLGALDPEEAIYPGANRDAAGEALNGSRKYILRFERGAMPPAGAFWSLTMYNPERFLVENPMARYSIGDRTRGLRYGADGSLELYVQKDAPPGRESNWLPAPAAGFTVSLRLYLPKPEAVDGRWKPPAVKRLD